MHWSGDRATLTLTHLNKEDEGLYTLRVTTKSGYKTYSAYVFVRGELTFETLPLSGYDEEQLCFVCEVHTEGFLTYAIFDKLECLTAGNYSANFIKSSFANSVPRNPSHNMTCGMFNNQSLSV